MKIYVSYAWGDKKEKGVSREVIVDKLCEAFKKKGHEVRRDKTHMKYRDIIRDFMNDIGSADALIAIISRKYLKSRFCMYELAKAYDWGHDFSKRIFPIVLDDVEDIVYSTDARIALIKEWEKMFDDLDKKLASLSFSQKAAFEEEYSDLSFIKEKAHIPLAKISGMTRNSDAQKLMEEKFEEIINQVLSKSR
ncbi:toll/interleukin-1 receptor domain-containing protein [Flammeovirgaceae bacterium SG7u.111]|nr:toll/interleukin-1 receptor domain-containing protein [Flammeovirgaceae bacterium SG7u.132]WPO37130.1 toll/interleukin-1 receptor domain-containing protein [Flammeovirgaceae bacterium SG7u.111]